MDRSSTSTRPVVAGGATSKAKAGFALYAASAQAAGMMRRALGGGSDHSRGVGRLSAGTRGDRTVRPWKAGVGVTGVFPLDIGFAARVLALCALPRRDPGDLRRYKRVNGPYRLVVVALGDQGLPWGSIPRLGQ